MGADQGMVKDSGFFVQEQCRKSSLQETKRKMKKKSKVSQKYFYGLRGI
jgi:hypothetical protein